MLGLGVSLLLLNCTFFNELTFSIRKQLLKIVLVNQLHEKSKEDLSFIDTFSRGSFDEYKGNFNEKVGTCFVRFFQFTCDWKKKSVNVNCSKRREKQNEYRHAHFFL